MFVVFTVMLNVLSLVFLNLVQLYHICVNICVNLNSSGR